MAHTLGRRVVSRTGGTGRWVLCLVGFLLTCYIVRPPSLRGGSNAALLASCSPCSCDCDSESDSIFTLPFDGFNTTFAECGKDDPATSEEMKKDIYSLLSEEMSLQKNVRNDSMERTKALIMDARKSSSHYQREAEKCNAGMETCEEARERAEAALMEESKLSALWETRAREFGWSN